MNNGSVLPVLEMVDGDFHLIKIRLERRGTHLEGRLGTRDWGNIR